MAKEKLKIAMSYSPEVGGVSSESARAIIQDLNAEVVNADYRKLVTDTNAAIEEVLVDSDKTQVMIAALEASKGSGANEQVVAEQVAKALESDKEIQQRFAEIFEIAVKNSEEYLKDKDGLLIPGNTAMVDPRLYGKEKTPDVKTDLGRSIAEMALIHVATKRGIPILAICGGHQILNTYHGGTLKPLSSKSLKQQGFLDYDSASLPENSGLKEFLPAAERGKKSARVNVFGAHNEAVDEVGGKGTIAGAPKERQDLFSVAALSSDKQVEAITQNYGAPTWGVQFHPEVATKGLGGHVILASSDKKDVNFAKGIFVGFVSSAQAHKNKGDLHQELLARVARIPSIDEQPSESREKVSGSSKLQLHDVEQKVLPHKESDAKLPVTSTKLQIKDVSTSNPIVGMVRKFLKGIASYFLVRDKLKMLKPIEKSNKLSRKTRVGGTLNPMAIKRRNNGINER